MVINHNIAALNTYNQLSKNEKAQKSSLEKLSSGSKINSAADDAAGLAISQKMTAQIKGLDQAASNAQNGISLVQTAEGALSETQSILQRVRELSVQSANDTNTSTDRVAIQQEVAQLTSEVNRISDTTQFNGKVLLDGSSSQFAISSTSSKYSNFVGTADTHASTITLKSAETTMAAQAVVTGGSVGNKAILASTAKINADSTISIAGKAYSFTAAVDTVDSVLAAINTDTAASGVTATWTTGNGFSLTSVGVGENSNVTITAAGTGDFVDSVAPTKFDTSVTRGANLSFSASSASALGGAGSYAVVGNHVNVTGGTSKGLQFDVSAKADTILNVGQDSSLTLQIGSNAGQALNVSINNMSSSALGINGIDISSHNGANSAITVIDTALSAVSTERSKLGAVQNRLDHTINNLTAQSQNMSAASSQITDVDMAKEMMNYTKNNILNQAAQAMLAQANQLPQGALQLLK